MSYRRRHRWFRRMVLGLALSVAVFAGRASVASAKFDEGAGSRYVSAGGWSGEVDMETGIPVSAGIPQGDEQFVDPQGYGRTAQEMTVIPYLSHGILTESDARAAAAEAIHDPYLTDVASASEGNPQVIPYLSHGVLTESDAQALAAQAIADPNLTRLDDRQVAADGDQVAMANAVESQRFVPGVTDFPTSPQVDSPQVVASSGGSTIEWNEALTVGIGAFVLVLGLGLAFGYLKRPRLAGL